MPNSKFASISGKIAIVFSVILAIAGSISYFNYARFHGRVELLRTNGELKSLEEIYRRVEDPADDALTYLESIFEEAIEVSALIPRDEDGWEITDAESIALFDELSEKHADMYANISLAAKTSTMSLTLNEDHSQEVNVLDLQKVGILLAWKGKMLIAKGDVDGGANTALELLQLADAIEQPLLLTVLLSNSFRVNAFSVLYEAASAGKIDESVNAKLSVLLDEFDPAINYRTAVETERSIVAYYIINSDLGAESPPSGIVDWLTTTFPAGYAAVVGNSYLDQMETAIERCEIGWSTQIEPNEEASWAILSPFGRDVTSVYNNFRNTFGRSAAHCRAIRTVLALDQNDDSIGRDEWSVGYLASIGVPEKMSTDPFTDKPLVVKRSGDRWVVYSLGPDKLDGQGERVSDDCGMVPRPTK